MSWFDELADHISTASTIKRLEKKEALELKEREVAALERIARILSTTKKGI